MLVGIHNFSIKSKIIAKEPSRFDHFEFPLTRLQRPFTDSPKEDCHQLPPMTLAKADKRTSLLHVPHCIQLPHDIESLNTQYHDGSDQQGALLSTKLFIIRNGH